MPSAVAEAWTGVLAGLIPILGLLAVGYLLIRAAREPDDEDEDS